MKQFATDLFENGSQGEVLKKNSNANMDFGWGEGGESLPEGGNSGDVLTKGENDNATWSAPASILSTLSGNFGDVLTNGENDNATWSSPASVLSTLPGADNGGVLMKTADSDYVSFEDINSFYPKFDMVTLYPSGKKGIALINREDMPYEIDLGNDVTLQVMPLSNEIDLRLENNGDETANVVFNLNFAVEGDYGALEIGSISNVKVKAAKSPVLGNLNIYIDANNPLALESYDRENITIGITGSGFHIDTHYTYSYQFPDYVVESD